MKKFHISDILSITTGRLVSTRHMDGIYDILDFMTGESLQTIALIRASQDAKPYLYEQFPWLKEIDKLFEDLSNDPNFSWREQYKEIIDELAQRYGEMHSVKPMPKEDRVQKTLEEELDSILGPGHGKDIYYSDGKGIVKPKNN